MTFSIKKKLLANKMDMAKKQRNACLWLFQVASDTELLFAGEELLRSTGVATEFWQIAVWNQFLLQ